MAKVKTMFSPFQYDNLTHFATLTNTEQTVISMEEYIDFIVSADNEFGVTINFSKKIPP